MMCCMLVYIVANVKQLIYVVCCILIYIYIYSDECYAAVV